MKHWEKVINHKWQARANHCFILYLNVADLIFDEQSNSLKSVIQYLMDNSVIKEAPIVAIVNRELGYHFPNPEMEGNFKKLLKCLGIPERELGENKIEAVLRIFSKLLRISWNDEEAKVKGALEECFPDLREKQSQQDRPLLTLIIEHLETKTPPDAASGKSEDRDFLEALLGWAQSKKIADSRNIVIGLAESLSSIAPQLRAETNGVTLIKLSLPDSDKERESIIQSSLETCRDKKPDYKINDTKLMASWSSGLSRITISNLIKDFATRNRQLSEDDVFMLKKKFIEEQSGGLLEIEKTIFEKNALGGLQGPIEYMEEIVAATKSRNFLAVPQGTMILGAPGVGKTRWARVFAKIAGVPFLKMKNVREMWVGQSERNLDFAIELAIALAPAVILIDEIDQETQSRNMMFDNTGVNNRIQRKLFEVMSDTELRGKLLWVGISNRPDLLDEAMLREGRFDDKLVFFPPDAKERALILPAVLQAMKTQEQAAGRELHWNVSNEFCEEFGWRAHRHLKQGRGIVKCDPDLHVKGKEADDEIPLNGGQIEKIAIDAYRLACRHRETLSEKHLLEALENFIPPHSILKQAELTDLALLYCNTERFLPDKWKKRLESLRGQHQQEQKTILKNF